MDDFFKSTSYQLKQINTLEYTLLAIVPVAILYMTCWQYMFKRKEILSEKSNSITDINALMKNLNDEETTISSKIAVR